MTLSVIQGGLDSEREHVAKLRRQLLDIAEQLTRDVEAAQRITGSEDAVLSRSARMCEAADRAQHRLVLCLDQDPDYIPLQDQATSDRTKLYEIQKILEGLGSNLGLYLS